MGHYSINKSKYMKGIGLRITTFLQYLLTIFIDDKLSIQFNVILYFIINFFIFTAFTKEFSLKKLLLLQKRLLKVKLTPGTCLKSLSKVKYFLRLSGRLKSSNFGAAFMGMSRSGVSSLATLLSFDRHMWR